MKKRIISLILVAVMAVLTLAGCGYSYAKDDMSNYATFDKAKFEAALSKITLEDGDFTYTEDGVIRAEKVADAIAKALAAKADTEEHKTEGTVGANDMLYYCYYVTATIKDVDYIFLTENMKVEEAKNMDSVQLGINFIDDEVAQLIAEHFAGFEFTADNVYTQKTEGKLADGDVAYLTYTREYTTTTDEGENATVKETASSHRVVIDKTNNAFHAQLIDKEINKSVSEIKIEEGDQKGTYSGIKINWVEDGAPAYEFKHVTFDEATAKPSTIYTTTKTQDLKGVELTYHVYPAYFVETPALTADFVMNEIYGDTVTFATIAQLLFGEDYTEGEADEVEALLEPYKFTKDGEELSLEDFVTAIDNAQAAITEAEEARDTAKIDYDKSLTALKDAKTALDAAEKALNEAKESGDATVIDEKQKAFDEKEDKYKVAVADYKVDREIYDGTKENAKTPVELAEGETYTEGTEGKKGALIKAEAERDTLVTEFFTVIGEKVEGGEGDAAAKGRAKFLEGYEYNIQYKNLESAYNEDIKTKLATYVYEAIAESVTVNSYPKKAVKNAYNYLIENYEYMFYQNKTVTGSSVSSSSDSNYKKYNGSFETFLVQYAVPEDLDVEVSNADEAYAAIEAEAKRHVAEVVSIYIVADAYGKVVSDKEFKKYLDDENNSYYADAYGEDAVRSAYQFDQLFDYLLENEEVEEGKATIVEWKNSIIGEIELVEELPDEEDGDEPVTE